MPRLALLLLAALLARPILAAEPPRIVTDIAPVQSLAAMVTGETPVALLPPGADAHGYSMRPSDARALSRADVIFWIGPALTPWLADATETLGEDATRVELLDTPGLTLLHPREGAAFGTHDHGEGTSQGTVDPHIWLDPRNAAAIVTRMAEVLASADPDRATLYEQNAATARDTLAALEDEIAARLAPVTGTPFLVAHDAFHYFEARFGIEAAGALSASDAAAPGAARLGKVQALARDLGIACIFVEPQQPDRLAEQLAAETGARLAPLDPLGTGLEPGASLYPRLMRDMAEAIADCLANAG